MRPEQRRPLTGQASANQGHTHQGDKKGQASMLPITHTISIAAPTQRVWAALTEQPAMFAWLGERIPVQLDARVGGAFTLFGGEISGSYTHVEPPTRLVHTWRTTQWPSDWADSVIEWHLAPEGQSTRLTMTQHNLPSAEERQSHDERWDVLFLKPMQAWLEAR
jgi:uncharacterized protein YndB with AHSA1/START domain